jgi:hypothetical protein
VSETENPVVGVAVAQVVGAVALVVVLVAVADEEDEVAEVVAATDAMTDSVDKFLTSVGTQEKQSLVTENFLGWLTNFQ